MTAMTTSALIKTLQEVEAKYGTVPVHVLSVNEKGCLTAFFDLPKEQSVQKG